MLRSQDGRVYAWEELRAFYVLWLTVWSSLISVCFLNLRWGVACNYGKGMERQCCCSILFYIVLGFYCKPWCCIVFYISFYCTVVWPLGSLVSFVHGRRKAPTYTKKQTEAGVRGHVCTVCCAMWVPCAICKVCNINCAKIARCVSNDQKGT